MPQFTIYCSDPLPNFPALTLPLSDALSDAVTTLSAIDAVIDA